MSRHWKGFDRVGRMMKQLMLQGRGSCHSWVVKDGCLIDRWAVWADRIASKFLVQPRKRDTRKLSKMPRPFSPMKSALSLSSHVWICCLVITGPTPMISWGYNDTSYKKYDLKPAAMMQNFRRHAQYQVWNRLHHPSHDRSTCDHLYQVYTQSNPHHSQTWIKPGFSIHPFAMHAR